MSTSLGVCKAALVQAAPLAFEREASIDRVSEYCLRAKERGAQLVVFPEAFISGYPKGSDFGVKVGFRTDPGRELYRRYWEAALELGSAAEQRLSAIARECQVYLVIGVIERANATLYCTALYYGPDGTLLGKHRKLVPTAAERVIWGSGDASTLALVDTKFGPLGAAICWENYMPLLRMSMYEQGVVLYCAPTVDDRPEWQATMRHIALEGRCFVLACAQFARRADFPADYASSYGDDPGQVMIRGGSVIFAPNGEALAGPLYDEAGIVVADLDIGDTIRGKFDLDVAGHYARPDVFELMIHRPGKHMDRNL